MAQALFKSWFVDFEPVKAKIAVLEAGGSQDDATLAAMTAISGKDADKLVVFEREYPKQYAQLKTTAELFPSTMQDSELGKIPEGWSIKPLDEIATYQNGLALQKFRPENDNDFLPVVKIAQLKKGFADGEEKASPNIKPECIINNGDVVFSWSGSLMVDIWCGGKAALNQHLFKVSSIKYPKWLYYKYTAHHLIEFKRIAEAKAVTMGHIKREHLSQAKCLVPSSETVRAFTPFFEPVLNWMVSNRLEARKLENLRDTLLPKLLSNVANNIRTTNLFYPLNSHLIHDHKAVIAGMVKIHQQRFIVDNLVITFVLNGYAVEQKMVEGFVTDDQIRALGMGDTKYHLFQHGNREMGVDGLQLLQHHRTQKHIMK